MVDRSKTYLRLFSKKVKLNLTYEIKKKKEIIINK